MSISLLYHAFGAREHDFLGFDYTGGILTIEVRKKRSKIKCPHCGKKEFTLDGKRIYLIQTVPIGMKKVNLRLHVRKIICSRSKCGYRGQESRVIAEDKKTYSKALARLVLDLSKSMTIQDISKYLKMGWSKVKDIIKTHLCAQEKKRSWRNVKYIAIDEIAVKKGHSYVTVIVDLESGEVLDAVEGRDSECLKPVFDRLKSAGAKLKAVAIDMSSSYIKAVNDYAPKNVVIVHDPFHIVQAVNKAVDTVRRQEHHRLSEAGNDLVKNSRYLLLRAIEKVVEKDADLARLENLLDMNENLNKAHILKEDLRQIWSLPDKASARAFLEDWIKEALESSLRPFVTLGKTLRKKMDGILAWYDYPITTGPLEGLNNKIKVLKRRGYGYRDMGFFRLLILFIHETKFNLTGT